MSNQQTLYSRVSRIVRFADNSPVTELVINEGGLKIRLKKPEPVQTQVISLSQPGVQVKSKVQTEIIDITSTMVGTVCQINVNVGDQITTNQVIGQIKAMTIQHDILSDVTGKVVEICVEKNQPIEYGQMLFKVEVQS